VEPPASMQSLLSVFCSVMVEPAAGVAACVVRGIAAAADKNRTPEKKNDRPVAFKRIPLKVFAGLARSSSLRLGGLERLGSLVTIGKYRFLGPEEFRAVENRRAHAEIPMFFLNLCPRPRG